MIISPCCHEMLNALIPVFSPDFKEISLVLKRGWFTEYVRDIVAVNKKKNGTVVVVPSVDEI